MPAHVDVVLQPPLTARSFVFEGRAPELKRQELAKRSSRREDATVELEAAKEVRNPQWRLWQAGCIHSRGGWFRGPTDPSPALRVPTGLALRYLLYCRLATRRMWRSTASAQCA